MTQEQKQEDLAPNEYFDIIKGKKHKVTDQQLDDIYDNCLELLNKYNKTGQTRAMKKLIFHLETIEKEKEIINKGIDTFVYYEDVTHYIQNISDETVKIIDIENYEREIPDDIVNVYEKVKDLFDKSYVVFTDYTGEVEKEIEKERDPILFGSFQSRENNVVVERFYFIGDWVDDFCDLTLSQMINETQAKENRNIENKIETPQDIEELKYQLQHLDSNGNFIPPSNEDNTQQAVEQEESQDDVKEEGILHKIKSFFSKG